MDVTSNANATIPDGGAGWKLGLQFPGEKILGESRTFAGTVFFTSFQPGSGSGAFNSCVAGRGLNRLYMVNAADSSPVVNLDGSIDETNLTIEDRSRVLSQGGIAPEVVILFPDDPANPMPAPACLVGLERCGGPQLINRPVRTTWRSVDAMQN